MCPDADAPSKVLHCVIDAFLPRVTDALHSIAAKSACAGGLVALPHVYWVRSVSKVVTASHLPLLQRTNLMARRNWKAKPRCGHGLWDGFEGHSWVAKCQ